MENPAGLDVDDRPVSPFACPVYEQDKELCTHSRRSCANGFPSRSRLMEHLKSRHGYYCPHCYRTFKDADSVVHHSQNNEGCTALNHDLVKALKDKRIDDLSGIGRATRMVNVLDQWQQMARKVCYGSTIPMSAFKPSVDQLVQVAERPPPIVQLHMRSLLPNNLVISDDACRQFVLETFFSMIPKFVTFVQCNDIRPDAPRPAVEQASHQFFINAHQYPKLEPSGNPETEPSGNPETEPSGNP